MNAKYYAVILAGGRGERFWPYSVEKKPKQLLDLLEGGSLLAQTMERLRGLVPADQIYVITSRIIAEAVSDVLADLPPSNIVAEPCGRNTAPAIATAAGIIRARDPGAVFSVLPSDHVIQDVSRFQRVLNSCYLAAMRHDVLITIGIRPSAPSTGYGYVEAGEVAFTVEDTPFLRALRFVEKPDLPHAQEYVASGRFCWNAGMFVWSVAALEKAFGRFRPDMAAWLREVCAAAPRRADLDRLLSERYSRLENISIDYALMEKADNIVTVTGDFGWDDVGTWDSLGAHLPQDDAGNAVLGDMIGLDACGNTVVSEKHLTALVGVKDLIVVHTKDATLVCHKSQAERVKQLVELIRRGERWKHLL